MVLTDWMVARLIRLDWVQKLDQANIPNSKNLEPSLQHRGFDPGRVYSLPWQSGFTGIAYNPKATGGKKIDDDRRSCSTNPTLKGKVTLLTEMRDTMGLTMLDHGQGPGELHRRRLRRRDRRAPEGRRLRPDPPASPATTTARASPRRHRGLHGVVRRRRPAPGGQPEHQATCSRTAGTCSGRTTSLIPNKAQHKKNAEMLINYYYDPAVAAELDAYVNYISPVSGAKDEPGRRSTRRWRRTR